MTGQQGLRALVLSAGLGTRLRPLTHGLPKPLLPVLGEPLVARTLVELAAVGCERTALNLHHLAERIEQQLGASFAGMPLVYSHEPELLGTLGAFSRLGEHFRDAEIALVINGDSLCRWPLGDLLRQHRGGQARVTLMLSRGAPVESFGGGVGVDAEGRVVSLRPGGPAAGEVVRRYVFAGAHALDPALVADVEARPADIVRDLYEPLLAAGEPLGACLTNQRWHDLGTPARYLAGVLATARGSAPWPRSWVAPTAVVERGARLRRAVIEAGARVDEGARVEGSLMLPGSQIGEAAVVDGSILGFDTALPAGSRTEGQMVSRVQQGYRPGPHDTVIGDLVYTPIEPTP